MRLQVRLFVGALKLTVCFCSLAVGNSNIGMAKLMDSQKDPLVERFACGRNSVFIMLAILGVPIDEHELSKALGEDPGPEGVSLLQLKNSMAAAGVKCVVRQLTFDELKTIQLPAIAHLTFSHSSDSQVGHFVVLVKVGEKRVSYIDSTTSTLAAWRTESFLDVWSGSVLQPAKFVFSPQTNLADAILYGISVCLSTALILCLLPVRAFSLLVKSFAPRLWFLRTPVVSITMGLICASAASGQNTREGILGEEGQGLIWRNRESDAINCSYLFLRLYGLSVDYSELRRLSPPIAGATFLNIREICRGFGLPVVVAKWSPQRLKTTKYPVIAHISDRLDRGGEFVLVVAANDDTCYIVRGSSVTIDSVSMDSFRRHWSGYVAVIDENHGHRLAVAIICTVIASVYVAYRKTMGNAAGKHDV